MEFTISRRVRRRGIGFLVAAAAGCVGLAVWLAFRSAPGVTGPLVIGAAAVICGWSGVRELHRAGLPFRLRVDAFGLTLHDAELSWEQIDAVALRYTSAGDDESAPPKPHLTVWTAPGVKLPRRADRTFGSGDALGALGAALEARARGQAGTPAASAAAPPAPSAAPADAPPAVPADRPPGTPAAGPGADPAGRRRYTLLDTGDLDQSLGQLTAALAAHAGARFETAPRSVRTPTPVTVAGPERRVPGGERVFRDPGRLHGLLAVFSGLVTLGALIPAVFAFTGHLTGLRLALLPPGVLLALLAGVACAGSRRRSRRPRELRVGPEGIAAREPGGSFVSFGWEEVAALTVGPRPGADRRPWLLVWPLPGTALPSGATPHLVDGHLAVPLIALPLVPGGPEAALPHVAAFAGERFSG